MSQEIVYSKAATISAQPSFQETLAPIITQIMSTVPLEMSDRIKHCCGQCHEKEPLLLAASKLKVINTDYKNHLLVMAQKCDNVERLKFAALATLAKSCENLLVADREEVANRIQRIVDAGSVREVNKEIRSAFKEIKKQHTETFVSNLTRVVAEAAMSVGFKKTDIQDQHNGLVRIVGTNHTGQNLVAEIETDKDIDIHTELIGFSDGSCQRVMQAFDDAMAARGLSVEHKVQTPTLGVPQMAYAKMAQKRKETLRFFFDDETANIEKTDSLLINTLTI